MEAAPSCKHPHKHLLLGWALGSPDEVPALKPSLVGVVKPTSSRLQEVGHEDSGTLPQPGAAEGFLKLAPELGEKTREEPSLVKGLNLECCEGQKLGGQILKALGRSAADAILKAALTVGTVASHCWRPAGWV